jgi:hypothetical protein
MAPKLPAGIVLRPSVINSDLWHPERPPRAEWDRIRKAVLERDDHTCRFCGHRALKYMSVHHLEDSSDNALGGLSTICVACHAVLHIGLNLQHNVIEIWKSDIPQIDIVRRSREGIKNGLSLAQINKTFGLSKGPLPPDSLRYANDLINKMPNVPRAYLPLPLCAVFVDLSRWQLE